MHFINAFRNGDEPPEESPQEKILTGAYCVAFFATAVFFTWYWWTDDEFGKSIWNLIACIVLGGGLISFFVGLIVGAALDAWNSFQDM